jgi:small subunit ribosomal protein S20
MANNKSAKKRILTTERDRERNSGYKSSVRTAIKKVQGLVLKQAETTDIQEAFKTAQSLIDRAVLKGLYHKNKGSRDKARLNASISKMAQA